MSDLPLYSRDRPFVLEKAEYFYGPPADVNRFGVKYKLFMRSDEIQGRRKKLSLKVAA